MMRYAGLFAAWIVWTPLAGADVVTARTRDGRTLVVEGNVDDFTGSLLTIRTTSGVQQRFDAGRVLEVRTQWPPQKHDAERAFKSGQWQRAAELYSEAFRAESRTWAQRVILDQLMQCYQSLGRVERAGEVFVALVESDPFTPALSNAPLQWTGSNQVEQAKASQWLGRTSQPAAVLLGASQLLATPQSAKAASALEELASLADDHPAVAALAEAQLWRTKQATADAAEIDRWVSRLEQIPAELRAGPHLVIAQSLQRTGRRDQAVLHYLRASLLFPGQRQLAARGLDGAARLLDAAGRTSEAKILAEELVTEYPGSAEASAQKRLREP